MSITVTSADERAGLHLGPVGGRIIGEVLVGLMQADPNSYLVAKPKWQPTFGPSRGGSAWSTSCVSQASTRQAGTPHTRTAPEHRFGLSPQLTAFFTSATIRASSAGVNSFSANAVGHMAPSSRFAWSLKPNVAYLV